MDPAGPPYAQQQMPGSPPGQFQQHVHGSPPGQFLQHTHGSPPEHNRSSSDEIAQRFAGFFFKVLATEPEKVHLFYDQASVRSHLLCSRPPPAAHNPLSSLNQDASQRDESRWQMDGKRAEGTTKIHALIGSLREEGLVLTLEAVYSHRQTDGSLLVAALGLVAHVNDRRLDTSVESTDFDEDDGEDADAPTTFVEVFVLKQKAGIGGYFVTDDMLHLLSSPLETASVPRSPSILRQRLRETLEQLHEESCSRTEAEEELRLVKSHVTSSGMEIQTLRQTLEETQEDLEGKRRALEDALVQVSEVEARAEASERELRADLDAKHKVALEHVERQLQALQQQLQHSSRSREELQKSKDSIQAQLVEARGECRKLRDEVEKSKNANTSLDRELAQLKSRISTSTQVQVDELHDMRRQNEQLKDDVRAGKDALRDNQAVHEKDIRKYKSIADKFKNDIKKYLEEVERKERELQQGRRLASKLQTEVERLEREKRTAQENLQICRLSLKEKDKNREEHRPREPDVGDDQRLPKGGEGTSSSSVSTGSNRPKRMQAVADAQQQQQLHAEKSILEAERAQLLLQVEETQESLRSVELDRASLCERVLTLQDARDKAQAQNQRLECILGERGQQVQELEEAKVRAEDEVIQMRQNIEVLSHHLQEAKATASSREADALAAKEDALAAQRDATAWKDMYEASQGSASRIKDMHRRSGERIDALAAEKEAVHKECELLRQRLSRATDELAKVARGKVEAEEMLARAEESIRDEQERSAQLVARHKQALLDAEEEKEEEKANLLAEVKYLRQERVMYMGEDRQ